jgi:outer membrane autotransporter protein
VFFLVDTATLDTNTAFKGDILALTSISLTSGDTINCGAALAETGAVTLINDTITICTASASSVLPSSANDSQRAVANAIDTFVANGGTLPPAFLAILTLSPSQLAAAFTQLSGEAATGAAPAATQAMNSFLSLVTNPFDTNRPFAESPLPPQPPVYKAPVYKAAPAYAPLGPAPDPRRWGIWVAGYGDQSNAAGDEVVVGSHARSVSTFGAAAGLDYRVTPYTVAGFALGGGGTRFGLSDGLGGGHSDMFQAALYSTTRVYAAYVSAALAYAWHRVSTDRFVTVTGIDHLTADFSANNVGGRIEGGYRFAIPGVLGWPGRYGVTPYAAGQVQTFRTPSFSESAASGSSIFALAFDARTTTTARTELGAWFDWSTPVDYGTTLVLRTRAAWAHDFWSAPNITAMFEALPGSSFTVTGAAPASDLLLASAGAEIWFRNGFSLAAWFDGEFAEHSQKYAGTGRLRYTW